MRTGLVVDSTCDIPESFLQRNQIQILPLTVSAPDSHLTDRRHKSDGLNFYQQWNRRRGFKPTLTMVNTQGVTTGLMEQWIYDFDHLLVIAPHRRLNSTLHTVRETLVMQHPNIDSLRQQASLRVPFKVRVVESQNGLAGYGLTLYETLRLMGEKARSVDQIKAPLASFCRRLETFVLPAGNVQQLKSEPFALGWLASQQLHLRRQLPVFHISHDGVTTLRSCHQSTRLEEFMSLVIQRLGHVQLHNRLIAISYAGNPADLRVNAAYQALQQAVEEKQGRLLLSIMSPSSAAQLGCGAVSIAYAHDGEA